MGAPNNVPHLEIYYVVSLCEGKFSSDPPPDLPKIMTTPQPLNAQGKLLVISYKHPLLVDLDPSLLY